MLKPRSPLRVNVYLVRMRQFGDPVVDGLILSHVVGHVLARHGASLTTLDHPKVDLIGRLLSLNEVVSFSSMRLSIYDYGPYSRHLCKVD